MEQEALLDSGNETQQRPAQQFFKQLAGYVLAGACLVWVFYDVPVAELWHTITVPLWAIGFFAIGRSGMTLKQIHADIKYLINMKQRASPG